MNSGFRYTGRATAAFVMLLAGAPAVCAQQAITGQVRHAQTLKPMAEVAIMVEGTSLVAVTDASGRFSIPDVPPGLQHLVITYPGFVPLRPEVRIGAAPPAPLDILIAPGVHYTEVVSVSPDARDPFESYQPTSTLVGHDLARQLQSTIGATLQAEPGVAERSFGPGASRPVIRGLDGDRVLILEDGQRVGDLSSQSGDHGVAVNPASASRIEVVRGPATLLYGASAIGGLVNVISETIPTTKVEGMHGGVTIDLGSAAREVSPSADMRWGNGHWAVNVSGSGRRSDDVRAPDRTIENTQSRGGFASLGTAWTGQKGFIGASYGYDDMKYGIPFVEEGRIQLTPRRHMIGVKAAANELGGFVNAFRASFAARRYRHEELEGDEIGTRFGNDTYEADIHLKHRPAGRLSGTIGGWFLDRHFSASGDEALSPPVHERGVAAFVYEEIGWPHVTLQFGGRLNHAAFDPEGGLPARDFTDVSGSVGLLLRPPVAHEPLTIALSLARAARNPALEELYFFGPHIGNFSFEIGNPALVSEKGLGFDASVRWRTRYVHGEVTYFRNSIDEYIFRNPISDEEFDDRFGHEVHAGEEEEEGDGHGEGLPIVEFIGADSVLQGLEAQAHVELDNGFGLELAVDYVRGTLRTSNEPLPRIPPLRVRSGVLYRRNAFQSGIQWTAAAKQDRVFGEETPTGGYNLLKLFASYSFGSERAAHTITARMDNLTDELYRNHLSLIKDYVPEMGRNVKLIYSVKF